MLLLCIEIRCLGEELIIVLFCVMNRLVNGVGLVICNWVYRVCGDSGWVNCVVQWCDRLIWNILLVCRQLIILLILLVKCCGVFFVMLAGGCQVGSGVSVVDVCILVSRVGSSLVWLVLQMVWYWLRMWLCSMVVGQCRVSVEGRLLVCVGICSMVLICLVSLQFSISVQLLWNGSMVFLWGRCRVVQCVFSVLRKLLVWVVLLVLWIMLLVCSVSVWLLVISSRFQCFWVVFEVVDFISSGQCEGFMCCSVSRLVVVGNGWIWSMVGNWKGVWGLDILRLL